MNTIMLVAAFFKKTKTKQQYVKKKHIMQQLTFSNKQYYAVITRPNGTLCCMFHSE